MAGPPVSFVSSPVNSPGPRTAIVPGSAPEVSTIATSPDLMTWNR